MTEAPAGDGENGFTLIEVLVAFAIVSLCLASLYAAMGAHARQMAIIDLHRQTLARARTQMEMLGETASQASPAAGEYPDGTTWRLSKRAIALGEGATDAPVRPFFVMLQAFDRSGHPVITLRSIKLLPVKR